MSKIIIIGHRGTSDSAVENTLNAFSRAIAAGVDMVEFDVRLTKDGEIVVFHDPGLKRMTGRYGSVKSKKLIELAEYKLTDGSTIPTLRNVLDAVDRKTKVNIEIKEGSMADKVAEVVSYYIKNKGWSTEHFNVSSFEHRELIKIKSLLPEVPIGVLLDRVPRNVGKYVTRFEPYSVNLSKDRVSRKIVEDIKSFNGDAKIFVYTVNTIGELKRLMDLGVDGVFSDYPDRIKAWATQKPPLI